MSEVVGPAATTALSQDPIELLKQLIFEVRTLQVLVATGFSIPDSLQRIRFDVKSEPESTFTP